MNAVKIEDLSKKYTILHEGKGSADYTTFRDVISGGMGNFWRKMRGERGDSPRREEIWALKDINLEIARGEKVGIIGRNGAGKTTLLKILSRITEPTSGSAEISGRVSSLLEVGTGFHPELTGRENIYLNGAVLGMKKTEIDGKFDEIVDFSGVEKFLDTPVKRFSSGMKVRLAFAVAAHLEPEILLVDEVLAVGDAEFQKKCLGKMDDVSRREGRTILFVSHNMAAIQSLCERVVFLEDGRVMDQGVASRVIRVYLAKYQSPETSRQLEEMISELKPDPNFLLKAVELAQSNDKVFDTVVNGEPLEIRITYEILQKITGLRVYIDLCDVEGALLIRSFHDEQNEGMPTMQPGRYVSTATIPANVLGPINYSLYIRASIFNGRNCLDGIRLNLNVIHSGKYNRAYPQDTFRGKLGFSLNWNTEEML